MYKRQAQKGSRSPVYLSTCLLAGASLSLDVEPSRLEFCHLDGHYRTPVSYTHLDVYKRQEELQEVKEKYGDPRRTQIIADEHEFNAEDFYPNDPVVITISPVSYTHLDVYKRQAQTVSTAGDGQQPAGRQDTAEKSQL